MRLTDILQPTCVKVPLEAADKQAAIYELVDCLANNVGIDNSIELKQAVWQREQTRTTGIGCGVAIPHGKCRGCKTLSMAIGRTPKPIDFGAIDGKPVELIILLASPPDQTGPHIQALASISRMLTNEDFRESVKRAETAEELYRLIVEQETRVLTG